MNLDTCTPGQRKIITTLDKPLMVSAGAGSGKTFTLTQRIAYALTESTMDDSAFASSIDQVLAITFTKKAAAELKSRIKQKLLELGLTTEALKVDDAWISTIHGMCSRMLREHALELGIDPCFEVLSETDANRLKDLAFDQVIFEIDQSDDKPLKDYIHSVGVTSKGKNDKSIQSYVATLSNKALAVPAGFDSLYIPPVEGNPSELMRSMIELAKEFISVSSALSKPTKTDAKHLQACEAALEKATDFLQRGIADSFSDPSFDPASYASVLFEFPKTTPKYRVKEGDPSFFSDYRQAYAHIASVFESAMSALELRFLTLIAKRVYAAFQEAKGPSRLDNVDLLRRAYEALVSHPDVARAYQEQFRMIMIDEFQDTDELQVAILSRIANPGFSNVCTVGDAQQSIYRFRGADVAVFYAYQEMLQADTEQPQFVNLPDNFRSHADILSFVDTIFSQDQVFGQRFLSLQPKGAVNASVDPVFENRPRISVSLYDCPSDGLGVKGGRQACARRIAQHFAELFDAGVSPSDMTLLLGSMSNVDIYAQALRDMGFECLVSGGSTFADSYEVTLLKAIVQYFSNPLNDEALYQVLSSPLFAISDEGLLYLATRYDREGIAHRRSLSEGFLTLKRECGLWDLTEDEKDALDFAWGCLKSARDVVLGEGLAAGVQELLRSSGWYIRLDNEHSAEAQAIVGNLYKALRMIESIEALGLGLERTVQRFIEDCQTLKLSPGTLSSSSSNFIEIMTIHASKGLEFPHVAVAEIRLDSQSENLLAENIKGTTYAFVKPQVLDSSRSTIKALKDYLDPYEGSANEVVNASLCDKSRALEAFMAAQELSEARRLLYVALTRASKSLFMGIAYRGKKEPDYTGKGVLEDLYSALKWTPSSSAPRQYLEYGGSAPLALEFQVVDDQFEQTHPLESFYSLGLYADMYQSSASSAELKSFFIGENGEEKLTFQQQRLLRLKELNTASESSKAFLIPGFPPQPAPFGLSLSRQHDEVCSYSSLHAEHTSYEVLEKESLIEQGLPVSFTEYGSTEQGLPALMSEDDKSPEDLLSLDHKSADEPLFDASLSLSDDATALGSAFHRLAQRAIDRASSKSLCIPDPETIAAQTALYSLSSEQALRLNRACSLWFGSDCAQDFASHAYRFAEVPFMVTFGPEKNIYLEGEIDALACDFPLEDIAQQPSDKKIAYLLDYKTGGMATETASVLFEKHLMQAQCYAYALLKQGFRKVEARFVRVEQPDALNPDEPQIQYYEFEENQLGYLETSLYQAYSCRPKS